MAATNAYFHKDFDFPHESSLPDTNFPEFVVKSYGKVIDFFSDKLLSFTPTYANLINISET